MALELAGIHHLTAVSADAPGNFAFYTQVLGMRLVKKTVNQDDVSAYHLFYADGVATPGTDLTFFEWPVPRERRGTRSQRAILHRLPLSCHALPAVARPFHRPDTAPKTKGAEGLAILPPHLLSE